MTGGRAHRTRRTPAADGGEIRYFGTVPVRCVAIASRDLPPRISAAVAARGAEHVG